MELVFVGDSMCFYLEYLGCLGENMRERWKGRVGFGMLAKGLCILLNRLF